MIREKTKKKSRKSNAPASVYKKILGTLFLNNNKSLMKKGERKRVWRKINNMLPYVFLGTLLVLAILYCVSFYGLTQRFKLTVGTAQKYIKDSRGPGGTVYYSYEVSGKLYNRNDVFPELYSSVSDSIIGKRFPVAYDTTDVGNSRILITTKSFKRFSIQFPDSLAWIKSYPRSY